MKILKAENGDAEATSKLSSLNNGDVFRWADVKFEAALQQTDEETFYMVINLKATEGRKSIISLDGKLLLERDGDRKIIEHQAVVTVSPKK